MTNSRAGNVKVTTLYLSSDFTTTSTTMTDVTGLTVTLTHQNFVCFFSGTWNHAAADTLASINIMINTVATVTTEAQMYVNGGQMQIGGFSSGSSIGNVVKLQAKIAAGTLKLYGGSAGDTKRFAFTVIEF